MCPELRTSSCGQLLEVVLDHGCEPAQQPGPVTGAHRAPGREAAAAAVDGGSVSASDGERSTVRTPSVAGLTAVGTGPHRSEVRWHVGAQNLSNPRNSSQSVTADSKAASSVSAAFT